MEIKKIGIVGSGHIGGNLGILLGKAGYDIFYSSRHLFNIAQTYFPSG